jgi:hypothetical protein
MVVFLNFALAAVRASYRRIHCLLLEILTGEIQIVEELSKSLFVVIFNELNPPNAGVNTLGR